MKRHPWKRELLKLAADLRKKASRTDWSSVSLTNLEQNTYWAFLMVRKLLESNPTQAWTVPIISYLPRDDGGLHRPRELEWDLNYLCNEMVHSAFFAFNFWDDGTLRGLVFCSGRRVHLRYCIRFDVFVSILDTVGESSVEAEIPQPIKYITKR